MHDTATLKTQRVGSKREKTHADLCGEAMIVRLRPVMELTAKQLEEFCRLNDELRIEYSKDGELIIMPPVSTETGFKNADLTADFVIWAREHGGRVGDASAGYTLPNQAMLSPDVSWVTSERWERLTKKERQGFASVCPDFVLELRSRADRLPRLQRKMVEYIANGARLGWLIDPIAKQVFIYRPDQPVEHLKNPATLSGEPVLAGFTLDLARVWQ